THNVGFSQRGGEPVEPYLSDQWFVKMKPLAEIALREVMNGDIKFHPNHWIKTYEHWMNNIKDWCISRQLWWGHRIPVYYTDNGLFTAASNEDEARKKLGINSDIKIWQDEDVLDTWFSSWLWPLTTMGWNGSDETLETDDIKKFLPSDLLVTGPDIIFFWVARMIMATKKFKNEVPFKNVYFTSMIRDGQGRKLSKSLGNSPDPLNILDRYGADAVRFTMLYLAPLGSDVRMDVDVKAQDIPSMEIGRNFANKVWNAGRFLTMKKSEIEVYSNSTLELDEFSTSDNWIYSRLNQSIKYLNDSLDNFKVTDYSKALYDFIWRDFCDWYVEIFKLEFNASETDLMKSKKVNFALACLNDILKLLHPLMPFITEEIWHLINEKENNISISQESYPEANLNLINEKLEKDFEFIQTFVEEFRKMRVNANLGPSKPVKGFYSISEGSQDYDSILNQENLVLIKKLARLESFENQIPVDIITLGSVVRGIEVRIENYNIDIEKEIEKLTKEIERLEGQIEGINKKLSNETFVSKAPANVIENERKKQNDMTLSLETLKQNLKEFQNS
ncbi:MAG: class I tRNA ligase family protein, partial [Candidatus Kapabacteria bacterium]|nr:class I tRNA ligase family protein [Candidatus Kapabacteria bacterium]